MVDGDTPLAPHHYSPVVMGNFQGVVLEVLSQVPDLTPVNLVVVRREWLF
jgi:hypothetical protein